MAYKIIAGWKVDKIANILTQSFRDQQESIRMELRSLVSKAILSQVPEEIKKLWDKTEMRRYIWKQEVLYIRTPKTTICVSPNAPYLPKLGKIEDIAPEGSPLNKEIAALLNKFDAIFNQEREMYKKIQCTLSKLKTYNRIRDNFPEAYDVLITQVDKSSKEEVDVCTDVEKLRAQLKATDKQCKK